MSISRSSFGIIFILVIRERGFDASSRFDVNFELIGCEMIRATKFDGDALND